MYAEILYAILIYLFFLFNTKFWFFQRYAATARVFEVFDSVRLCLRERERDSENKSKRVCFCTNHNVKKMHIMQVWNN